jgi:3-oxoacid CoA-transferase subunit A
MLGTDPFYTPAGYGTEVADGKEVREFNGKMLWNMLSMLTLHCKSLEGDNGGI